jgi:hypothetical protein
MIEIKPGDSIIVYIKKNLFSKKKVVIENDEGITKIYCLNNNEFTEKDFIKVKK